MKRGIYLGPLPRRALRLARIAAGLAVLSVVVHAALYLRDRGELERASADLVSSGPVSGVPAEENDAELMRWLEAASNAGVAAVASPGDALAVLARTLPERVVLDSLSLTLAGPTPTMTLQATAPTERDVSELTRAFASEPRLRGASLLEERRAANGSIVVRVQAGLSAESPR